MTQSILTDIKKAAKKSLKAREDELANTQKQLEILSGDLFVGGELPFFKDKIAETGQFPLKPKKLEVLQINVGYMCNQVCALPCRCRPRPTGNHDAGNHGTMSGGHPQHRSAHFGPYRWSSGNEPGF